MDTCTCIYPENVYGLRSLSGETDHSATASPEAGRFSLPQEFCHLPHLCWQAFSKIISYHCDLFCVSTTSQTELSFLDNNLYWGISLFDADSGQQGPCVVDEMNKITGMQKFCGETGMAWPLSEWESTLTLAWTGFYCCSGSISSRKVFIHHCQAVKIKQ